MERLTLAPETDARAALADRALSFRVLMPAVPSLGVGTLRVLRIRELGEGVEILAGYDRYERIEARGPAHRPAAGPRP